MKWNQLITVIGAGPVGCLLAILLCRRGHAVHILEKRPDLRRTLQASHRSINLALSHRGWRALELVGLQEALRPMALPMKGRMIHHQDGSRQFMPYGTEGQAIYSLSRADLNKVLLSAAERSGAVLHFEKEIEQVDLSRQELVGTWGKQPYEVLFGADGAFSVLRRAYVQLPHFRQKEETMEHAYLELNMEARAGDFPLDPGALHIWPRHRFMLIALPNADCSFTCTLF
ncbi:MAG: FAD-dependent monooxygenase, partial [Cytophagales bacterium]|nr:FAD-dependent monooxygenase [Cytophagales bacterium]